jgi:hypothetical protein
MATPTLSPDFQEFLRLLTRHEVKYLLIGGYAVGLYGYVRSTADLDIWIPRSRVNAVRLVAALREFGLTEDSISPALFMKKGRIIRMGVPPFRLEIHTEISGIDFRGAFARRIASVIDGVSVDVIGLDDLKANQLASGRLKDQVDLEHLP